ncbi:MAG TPA: ribonuclease II [Rhodospirillaceae bacterium]|nr:MAG: ribonuclease II [Alphaproteobacteria bacterium GWF2_58_20]HAU29704.1 ribonuclease II [Rhodospirillaceae bacterium]
MSHKNSGNVDRRLLVAAHRAMAAYDLLAEYPGRLLAEVENLHEPARGEGNGIANLCHMPWVSIDNDDSLDLDQLSVAEAQKDGHVRIMVAVADVDALVHKGSWLDRFAETNTTSVYTAAGNFPMLPNKLSTNLTSLNEGEDRLAIVIEMLVDAQGDIRDSGIFRAMVRNKAKLAYGSVSDWLDGKADIPEKLQGAPDLADQVKLQDKVAAAMKALRHSRGALSLETAETRAVFKKGLLDDLKPSMNNRAEDLIEDLMVAANGVVARFLEHKGFPSLRRVLRSPERWSRIVSLAAEYHVRLPNVPDGKALELFLAKRRKASPDTFSDLSVSIVKLLGRGEYVLEVPGENVGGHFGLAVNDYSHATAPNRRFPDLVAHRLIKAALAGEKSPYASKELEIIAAHCTEQEHNATKVERQVSKSAAALLLEKRVGEVFDGIVTAASSKGTWVRISDPMAEGKLLSGHDGIDVGDHVRVRLDKIKVDGGFIDFRRVF